MTESIPEVPVDETGYPTEGTPIDLGENTPAEEVAAAPASEVETNGTDPGNEEVAAAAEVDEPEISDEVELDPASLGTGAYVPGGEAVENAPEPEATPEPPEQDDFEGHEGVEGFTASDDEPVAPEQDDIDGLPAYSEETPTQP